MRQNLVVASLVVLTALAPLGARAQSLLSIASSKSGYGLALDTTPAPAAFAGWCPTCKGHALIGPAHDALILTRRGFPVAHLGAGWLYAPGTTGTIASGGAIVAEGGVNLGGATRAALGQLPAAADALEASSSWIDVAARAITIDGFYGGRLGGADGIPKTPYGVGAKLQVPFSSSALSAFFGK